MCKLLAVPAWVVLFAWLLGSGLLVDCLDFVPARPCGAVRGTPCGDADALRSTLLWNCRSEFNADGLSNGDGAAATGTLGRKGGIGGAALVQHAQETGAVASGTAAPLAQAKVDLNDVEGATIASWQYLAASPQLLKGPEARQALKDWVDQLADGHPVERWVDRLPGSRSLRVVRPLRVHCRRQAEDEPGLQGRAGQEVKACRQPALPLPSTVPPSACAAAPPLLRRLPAGAARALRSCRRRWMSCGRMTRMSPRRACSSCRSAPARPSRWGGMRCRCAAGGKHAPGWRGVGLPWSAAEAATWEQQLLFVHSRRPCTA